MNIPMFQITDLQTLECSFHRAEIFDESYAETVPNINLSVGLDRESPAIKVYLTAHLTQASGEHHFLNGHVKMLGIFAQLGEMSEDTISSFCNINAPAILFPYIRETISSLSVRAGLRPIVLQPINFVELANQQQQAQIESGQSE